jgi:hypothetical protein
MCYSNDVVRASRRRQVGIPTYAFWAAALDPRTKKKLSKQLIAEDQTRLWLDLSEAVKGFVEVQQQSGQICPEQQQQQQQQQQWQQE